MSYILDALRKAERDRQVARIPTLATAHGGADLFRRSPWLWLAVGAGALALGGVVLYTWLAPPVRPDPAPAAQIAAPAPAAGAPPAADLATASPQALERTEPVPALERAPGDRGASAPRVAPVAPPTSSAPVPADVPKGPSRVSPAAPSPRVQAQAPPVSAPPAPGPRAQAQRRRCPRAGPGSSVCRPRRRRCPSRPPRRLLLPRARRRPRRCRRRQRRRAKRRRPSRRRFLKLRRCARPRGFRGRRPLPEDRIPQSSPVPAWTRRLRRPVFPLGRGPIPAPPKALPRRACRSQRA